MNKTTDIFLPQNQHMQGAGNQPTHPPTMLVIDDDPALCKLVSVMGTRSGFAVKSTSDPRKFDNLYSNDLDIVVLDLQMPHVDGIEIIRSLSERKSQASLVLVSAFDAGVLRSARELAESNNIHVRGSLEKPFNIRALETIISGSAKRKKLFIPKGTDELPSVDELASAIESGEIHPYYQPRIDMKTKELVSVEALARWNHPTKGFIPPFIFVEMAEANGMVDELTEVMIISSMRQCAHWKTHHGIDLKMSVNFSYQSMTDVSIPDRINDRLLSIGLDPSNLIIELTESAVMNDTSATLDTLNRLRLKGIDLSIDDFGTGFSSVQQLYRVPFNELKIDQSFVRRMLIDRGAMAIVESTIDLARRLGMSVVAEGIETKEIYEAIKYLGCDMAQGYFIGKPMPGDDLAEWNDKWRKSEIFNS